MVVSNDVDGGQVTEHFDSFVKLGSVYFAGYDCIRGVEGLGCATGDWAAVRVWHSRPLMMSLLSMVKTYQVMGGD